MPRVLDLDDKVRRLRGFYRRWGRAPGYNEMLKLFGYASKNSVFGLIRRLHDEGFVIKRNRKIALTPKITAGLRLLGSVQAGFPSPAEEELADNLSLDEFLIRKPEATFMLKVSGDSMIDAGIHPGDLVLVERGTTPKNRDIVVAMIDGDATVKRLHYSGGTIELRPENPRFKPIPVGPDDDLRILGKVVAVRRVAGK